MLQRFSIPKFGASPLAPLRAVPQFKNTLFQQGKEWAQDVNYLRDTYKEVQEIWENLKTPEQDAELFAKSAPKLQELVFGLEDVSKKLAHRQDIATSIIGARHNWEISTSYGNAGDFASATIYQSYALNKVHTVLDALTRTANRPFQAAFLKKRAYGYDISGEVTEGMGSNQDQETLEDTAEPQDHHENPTPNPANVTRDIEAEKEFPELKETMEPNIYHGNRIR